MDSLLAIANKHGVSTDVNLTTSKESTSEVILDDWDPCYG